MAYIALYRKYRPLTFDAVFGQEHIVATIKSAIANNKVAHAYLFNGPRGTGKTTVARLIAKAVNCESVSEKPCGKCDSCLSIQKTTHPDIVEIDAASNNGVEEIRQLIENVKYTPLEAKVKVYIIDEVHMLTTSAFNALLKTLEDPPKHVIFILATTEAHKVLPTIISRCQRFDFSKVSANSLVERLSEVLVAENIKYQTGLLEVIAELSDGGMRDALSILDQLVAYGDSELNVESLYKIYGLLSIQDKVDLLTKIKNHEIKAVLEYINKINDKSLDIRRLTNELVEMVKETIVYNLTKNDTLLKKLKVEQVKLITDNIETNQLLEYSNLLLETADKYRNAANANLYFENCLLKMMELENTTSNQSIINKNKPEEKIEEKIIETVQKVEKPTNIISSKEFSNDYYLSLLFRASKSAKTLWSDVWDKLKDYRLADDYKVIVNGLLQTKLFAAGDDFIITTCNYDEVVQQLNQENLTDNKSKLAKEVCGKFCKIFIINDEQGKSLVQEFKKAKQSGSKITSAIAFDFSELEKSEKTEDKHPLYEMFDNSEVEEIS